MENKKENGITWVLTKTSQKILKFCILPKIRGKLQPKIKTT